MLQQVLGYFSQDLAMDLGTHRTRVFCRDRGLVHDDPTVLTVHTPPTGQRRVVAIGSESAEMIGRTPKDLLTIRPIKTGRMIHHEAAEAYIRHTLRRVNSFGSWVNPTMGIAVANNCSERDAFAIRTSCQAAGAREVHLIPRSLAAAMGAGLPVAEARGSLVVDMGASCTEITLISLGSIICNQTVQGGGDELNEAISKWLQGEHGLEVGLPHIEQVKHKLARAMDPDSSHKMTVRGRCLALGVPRAVTIDAVDVYQAIRPSLEAIVRAIRTILHQAPPELGADVMESGIMLTGAAAKLDKICGLLSERTGMAVICCAEPELAVVRGTSEWMQNMQRISRMAS